MKTVFAILILLFLSIPAVSAHAACRAGENCGSVTQDTTEQSYILFVTIWSSTGVPSVAMQTFGSASYCEAARDAIIANLPAGKRGARPLTEVLCLPNVMTTVHGGYGSD
jgi:hypothetical protein